jgi:hypothetical protein
MAEKGSPLPTKLCTLQLDNIVTGGEGTKKYPAKQCKVCAAHMK